MTEEMTELTPPAAEVVSVKFRGRGKNYFFDPAGLQPAAGAKVVVDTSKGPELGTVTRACHQVDAGRVTQPLRRVLRLATDEDLRLEETLRQREREAFVICRQKIAAHGLEMKLVDVECSFSGSKILFFFSSDGRVDFRELVRDLAGVFRTRIELRQIGVRDEARMLGGIGMCGRTFCCGSFMGDFAPVSTKMAKTQAMSLNPAKISGCCGRLMCCLRYEQAAYEELVTSVPKNGAFVETPDGYGNVTQVNVLRQYVKVKLDGPGDDTFRIYPADEVAAIPGGRPRDGSQPPHVLVLKPREPEKDTPPAPGGQRQLRSDRPAPQRRGRGQEAAQKPAREGAGQRPPREGAAQKPPREGAGQKPAREGAGQKPPREGTAQKPPREGTAQKPPRESAAQKPAREGAGQRQGRGGKPQRYSQGRKPAGEGQTPHEKPAHERSAQERSAHEKPAAQGQKHRTRPARAGAQTRATGHAEEGKAESRPPRRNNNPRRRQRPKSPEGGAPKQED